MTRHDTFNAFKSISSSEQFTEEASWCAILTYVSLHFSSLRLVSFFFRVFQFFIFYVHTVFDFDLTQNNIQRN